MCFPVCAVRPVHSTDAAVRVVVVVVAVVVVVVVIGVSVLLVVREREVQCLVFIVCSQMHLGTEGQTLTSCYGGGGLVTGACR